MEKDFKKSTQQNQADYLTRKYNDQLLRFIINDFKLERLERMMNQNQRPERVKIAPEHIALFFHQASEVYTRLQKIYSRITYPIFCQYLDYHYSFCQQKERNKTLAPATIIAYFKSERNGDLCLKRSLTS